MMQADPLMRPTIDEAVARYGDIRKELSKSKLHSRVQIENSFVTENLHISWKRAMYVLKGIRSDEPPLPAQ